MTNILRSTAVAAVLSVAVFGGTGPAVTAAPSASTPTTDPGCQAEQRDVRDAERRLARVLADPAAAPDDAHRARAVLRREQADQARRCAPTQDGTTTAA